MSKLAGMWMPAWANVPNSHWTRPSLRWVQKLAPNCLKPSLTASIRWPTNAPGFSTIFSIESSALPISA